MVHDYNLLSGTNHEGRESLNPMLRVTPALLDERSKIFISLHLSFLFIHLKFMRAPINANVSPFIKDEIKTIQDQL